MAALTDTSEVFGTVNNYHIFLPLFTTLLLLIEASTCLLCWTCRSHSLMSLHKESSAGNFVSSWFLEAQSMSLGSREDMIQGGMRWNFNIRRTPVIYVTTSLHNIGSFDKEMVPKGEKNIWDEFKYDKPETCRSIKGMKYGVKWRRPVQIWEKEVTTLYCMVIWKSVYFKALVASILIER